jgi:acylphosphatase
LPDGTVEMVAQGTGEDINGCIRDLEDSFLTYITETKIEEVPPEPQYKEFKITF